jgi:hypothetical protein
MPMKTIAMVPKPLMVLLSHLGTPTVVDGETVRS